jgi:Pentapeptide repeats (9 copies)
VRAFRRDAWFNHATFTGDAWFLGAIFTGDAQFGGATFTGDALFGGATFTGNAGFLDATFTGDAWFGGAIASGLSLDGAQFRSPEDQVPCCRREWVDKSASDQRRPRGRTAMHLNPIRRGLRTGSALIACGALISACGNGSTQTVGNSATTSPTAGVTAAEGPAPPSTSRLALSKSTEVIVTCAGNLSTGDILHIYDANNGRLLATQPGARNGMHGTYAAPDGSVQVTANNSHGCVGTLSADFTKAAVIAEYPDHTQLPAVVTIADRTLHLMAPHATTSNSFSAPAPTSVLAVAYDPAGRLWWVEQDAAKHLTVRNDAGASTQVEVPGSFSNFGFTRTGEWYVGLAGDSGDEYRLASGKVVLQKDSTTYLNLVFGSFLFKSDLVRLLPESQYSVSDGEYEFGGTRVVFFGTPPGNKPDNSTLFTVPNTGGQPTRLTDGVPAEQILYFGKYQG